MSLWDSWDHPGALWLIVVHSWLECGPIVALLGLLGSPVSLWLIVVQSRLVCGPMFVLVGLLFNLGKNVS